MNQPEEIETSTGSTAAEEGGGINIKINQDTAGGGNTAPEGTADQNQVRASPAVALKQVPQELVVDVVVVLEFRRLDKCAQQPGAPVGRGLLQVAISRLYVLAQQFGNP